MPQTVASSSTAPFTTRSVAASKPTTTTTTAIPIRRPSTQAQVRPPVLPPASSPSSSRNDLSRSSTSERERERSRTRSVPTRAAGGASSSLKASGTSSASSSATSLPRPAQPQSSGVLRPSRSREYLSKDRESGAPRSRTLSGSTTASNGAEGARTGAKTTVQRRPVPPVGAGISPPPPSSQTRPAPRPPASSLPSRNLPSSAPTAPSSSNTSNHQNPQFGPAHPQRRPSLASPLPPTPIVPSSLPRAAVPRSPPPAPLNLASASSSPPSGAQMRQPQTQHPGYSNRPVPTGSGSPQNVNRQQPQSSSNTPPAPIHRSTTSTTSASASNPNIVPPATSQRQTTGNSSHLGPPAPTHAQRPSTAGASVPIPDSPSTRAMMKRLLAKPAPVVSGFHAASGSESEGWQSAGAYMTSSHTAGSHTRRKESASLGLGGGRKEAARRMMAAEGMGIEFDMNMDALERTIASLGERTRDASKYHSPWEDRDKAKSEGYNSSSGKDKEKKTRNVLRRRPSTLSTSGPGSPSSPSYPASPQKRNPSASPSRHETLPALGTFSPLTLSPLGISSEDYFPSISSTMPPRSPNTAQPPRSPNPPSNTHLSNTQEQAVPRSPTKKSMQRSASASAAMPLPMSLSPRQSSFARPETMLRAPPLPYASSGHASRSGSSSPSTPSHRIPSMPASPASSYSPPGNTGTASTEEGRQASTPAALLAAAYKKQEKEREVRRKAAEAERRRHQAERAMVLGGGGGRRYSVDGARRSIDGLRSVDRSGGEGMREAGLSKDGTSPGHGRMLSVPPRPGRRPNEAEMGAVSEEVRKSFATGDSELSHLHIMPRVEDAVGASAGAGFDAIAKMAQGSGERGGAANQTAGDAEVGLEASDKEPAATPYYTVFGSSSGRVVAVGGPQDSWANAYPQSTSWASDVLGRRTTISASASPVDKDKSKPGLGRTLSRKVSARWKKQPGGGVYGDEAGAGRASMQYDKSKARRIGEESLSHAHGDVGRRRSLRLSMDNAGASTFPFAATQGQAGASDSSLDVSKQQKAPKQEPGGSPASATSASGGSGGGRFWKLMRRISVGGLKERYHDANEELPPVPALPRDYAQPKQDTRYPERARSHESVLAHPAALSGSIISNAPAGSNPVPGLVAARQPKPSAIPISSSKPTPSSIPAATIPTPATKPPASTPTSIPAPTRPSTTTRSSSPVSSSDVASSKFFTRPHSGRSSSSSSSLGEAEVPPLPGPLPSHSPVTKPRLQKHILPPNELVPAQEKPEYPSTKNLTPPLQMDISHDQDIDEQGWEIVRSPSVEMPSLLPPPRRAPVDAPRVDREFTNPGKQEIPVARFEPDASRPPSPTIPAFSTQAAVNAFAPSRRLSAALSSKYSGSNPVSPVSARTASPLHPVSPLHAAPVSSMYTPPCLTQSNTAPASPMYTTNTSGAPPISPMPTSLPPPPRPLRSAQRPPPASSTTSNTTTTPFPTAALELDADVPAIRINDFTTSGRKSESHAHERQLSDASTARARRRSSTSILHTSGSRESVQSTQTASSLQFRRPSIRDSITTESILAESVLTVDVGAEEESEVEKAARWELSEQEKAAKWDDLLERSERAGGTLRVAGGHRI